MRAMHRMQKDHPRVGGEKHTERRATVPGVGSPPRGRGKELVRLCHLGEQGITPAWAGKSLCHDIAHPCKGDHPRVGGEKSPVLSVAGFPTGSPPRGRGKVQFGIHALGGVGITPAWAGKSLPVVVLTEIFQDHPRVGGEKASSSPIRDFLMGSPPRGRGKAAELYGGTWERRITPAWAGKS